MSLFLRAVAGFIPPAEVSSWVTGVQTAIYLNAVLSTLVIYDAGEFFYQFVIISLGLTWFSMHF